MVHSLECAEQWRTPGSGYPSGRRTRKACLRLVLQCSTSMCTHTQCRTVPFAQSDAFSFSVTFQSCSRSIRRVGARERVTSNPFAFPHHSHDCGPLACASTSSGRNNNSCPCRRITNTPLGVHKIPEDVDGILFIHKDITELALKSFGHEFPSSHRKRHHKQQKILKILKFQKIYTCRCDNSTVFLENVQYSAFVFGLGGRPKNSPPPRRAIR